MIICDFLISPFNPRNAKKAITGYTTIAIKGNGIPKKCVAGCVTTLVQDIVWLISQNEEPSFQSPSKERYVAFKKAITDKISIIFRCFFMGTNIIQIKKIYTLTFA